MSETLDTKKTLEWIERKIIFDEEITSDKLIRAITNGELESLSYQWRPVEDGGFPKDVYLPVIVKYVNGYNVDFIMYDSKEKDWKDGEGYMRDNVKFYFILPEAPKGREE